MNQYQKIITVLSAAAAAYSYLICPRIIHRPDRSFLLGRHYAHRGLFNNTTEAPENSIPAFVRAAAAGYGIELDVQLSKDNVPVVFHDASLKRMCGVDKKVWECTLAELKQMHLADSSATIPTFEEALAAIDKRVPIIVEYKLDIAQTTVCELANELLDRYGGPYCIECFHPLALIWYRKNRPDIIRGQLGQSYWKEKQFRGKARFLLLGLLVSNVATRPDFIAFKHQDAGNLPRRLCRLFGALSVAWTIKSEKDYEKAKNSFDLFIFDSCRLPE